MTSPEQTPDMLDPVAIKAQLSAAGYAVLMGRGSDRGSDMIAEELGRVLVPPSGSPVQTLRPRETSTPNTYSGIFGLGRFPFHTDLAHWRIPPRYLLLRCVRGYADVPTLLVDGRVLVNAIGPGVMGRALLRPRRPQNGEVRMLRLHERSTAGEMLRWDEVFLEPASRVGEGVFSDVQERLKEAVPVAIEMVDDGDGVVIDNWRMLHSRPAIPPDRRDRHLERVYLESIG